MTPILLTLALSTGQVPSAVVRPLDQATVCAMRWGLDQRHVTGAMKRQAAQLAGVPRSLWRFYIFDHIIPRELAGADAVDNLQLQSKADAHRKDVRENALHRAVCQGTVTLDAAQLEMWTLWRTGR